jgi:hypothetical protein
MCRAVPLDSGSDWDIDLLFFEGVQLDLKDHPPLPTRYGIVGLRRFHPSNS